MGTFQGLSKKENTDMKKLRFTSCMAFLVNGMLAVMTGTIITYLVRDYGISQAAAGRMVPRSQSAIL